jgi:hypothetical protein
MKLAAAFVLVCLLGTGAGAAYAHDGESHRNASRGLVLTGLVRAKPSGPCMTGFELRLPNGRIGCTHGPDPAPQGQDVRDRVALTDIAATTSGDPAAESGAGGSEVVCLGDGVDGNRVQAVYAYPAAGPDNYDAVAPYIRHWAGLADQVFNESAAKTGGVRHVRYVTDVACQVDVAKVALSEAGIESLGGTAADLAAQGHDRPDRKYLVWVDAYKYCGIAMVEADDRAAENNANNGASSPGMVARVDRGCWGKGTLSAEGHELAHILGGVQPTAPHGTWSYHCYDEWELMCYDDDLTLDGFVTSHDVLTPLGQVCPRSHEGLLDCGNDDYFSTSPAPESWLAQHWNVANSSFLTSEGPPSAPDREAPKPTIPRPLVVGNLQQGVKIKLSWTSHARDVVGYWLWMRVDGGRWRYVDRPDVWSSSAEVRVRHDHRYRFLVHAFDAAGNASRAVKAPSFRTRVLQERHRRVSFYGRWERFYRPEASRQHVALPTQGAVRSRLSFRGKAVAWVSSTSPEGGTADVFLDGRYVGTVDLTSDTAVERQVVFSHRFGYRRRHRIAVVPAEGSPAVAVDAFVILR